MTKTDPKVDEYVARATRWQDEITQLRAILLDCGLEEALKWMKPCYGFQGGNLAIIQPFKEHCSLMFFKGSRLDDPKGVLVRPGANSQAGMRVEFTSSTDVDRLEPTVRDFIRQAVELEEAGVDVDFKAKHNLELPEELTARLAADPDLAAAFQALTPGRRRGYVLHISGAKQSKTRAARVEKAAPKILAGRGFNER